VLEVIDKGSSTAQHPAPLLLVHGAWHAAWCWDENFLELAPAAVDNETKPEWYLRQMLGTANFHAGPVMAFMSGNLCYQIEHHLFPDLPSNRYPEISVRVRAILAEYDLPYTTGPLIRQFWDTVRTICKLSLPDRFLTATSE
jgi:NADPH-dependent stearoyl-CoA 9-desaturase